MGSLPVRAIAHPASGPAAIYTWELLDHCDVIRYGAKMTVCNAGMEYWPSPSAKIHGRLGGL